MGATKMAGSVAAAKKIGGKSSSGSLGVNVLLVTVGAVLLYSGFRGISVIDAALGRSPDTVRGDATASDALNAGALGSTVRRGGRRFDGRSVSNWIADELDWARANGWRGSVQTSRPGEYPNGSVIVSNSQQLEALLRLYTVSRLRRDGNRFSYKGPL